MNRIIFWKLGLALALTAYALFHVMQPPPPKETPVDRKIRQLETRLSALPPESPQRLEVERELEEARAAREDLTPEAVAKHIEELEARLPQTDGAERTKVQRELAGLYALQPKWYDRLPVKLGLDLRGGTEVRLRLRPDERRLRILQRKVDALREAGATDTPEAKEVVAELEEEQATLASNIRDAADVIRARLNNKGLAEIPVTLQGNDRVLVQLPGMDSEEARRIISTIQTAGQLEFRLVVEESGTGPGVNAKLVQKVRALNLPPNTRNFSAMQGRVLREDEIDENGLGKKYGDRLYDWLRTPPVLDENGQVKDPGRDYLVEQQVWVTGERITSARANSSMNNPGSFEVNIVFDTIGSKKFARVTSGNVGRKLAIVLDGELKSAPNINEPIVAGRAVISGDFGPKEAEDLAVVLKSGSLKVNIEKEFENTVGPTLGEDSIRQGLRAMLYGLVAVIIFMLAYYWIAGAVTDVVLFLNMLFILWILVAFNATLTLPGIAGLILTVGMAVDANVLIFERVREEREKGNSLVRSISLGYERAFVTILDANLTTFITALILHSFGTEAVKGFAITLMIGILTSMFCSLVLTRWGFEALIAFRVIGDIKMGRFFKKPNLDYLKLRRPAMVLSAICIVVGMIVFFSRGERNYGHDFTGGTLAHIALSEPISMGDARQSVARMTERGFIDTGLQSFGERLPEGFREFVIRTKMVRPEGEEAPEEDPVPAEGKETIQSARAFKEAIADAFPLLQPQGLTIDDAPVDAWSDEVSIAYRARISTKTPRSPAEVQELLHGKTEFTDALALPEDAPLPDLPESRQASVAALIDRVGEAGETVDTPSEYIEAFTAAIGETGRTLIPGKEALAAPQAEPLDPSLPDKVKVKFLVTLKRPVTERELLVALTENSPLAGVEVELIDPTELPAASTEPVGDMLLLVNAPRIDPQGATRGPEAMVQFVRDQFLALRTQGLLDFTEPFPRFTSVGPTVATEMKTKALLAMVYAMVAIFFYIWLRFQFRAAFGVGAVLALVHDVLFTLGALAIADELGLVNGQIDLTIVAALLTLVGYSLNDTIVVFDRIRENLHHGSRSLAEVINESVNQTVSRTVITSLTTLVVVLCLLLFGGGVIAGFAFCLFIGVLVGTYSSIFIASPILVEIGHWYARRQQAKAATAKA